MRFPFSILSALVFLVCTAQADEGIQCGSRRFSFRPMSGWTFFQMDETKLDANNRINQNIRTDNGSYEMKYTVGALNFDMIEGKGTFTIYLTTSCGNRESIPTSCKVVEQKSCTYTSPQSTKDPDFFTLDFCFGRTERIDSAILDGGSINMVKEFLGNRPFYCALHASKDLMPYLAKRSRFITVDPNELDAKGTHPLFFLSNADRLKSYIESFKEKIDFNVKDKEGNTVLHVATSKEILETVLNSLLPQQRTVLLNAENGSKLRPIETYFARYQEAPTRENLKLLMTLIDQVEVDLNPVKGKNILKGLIGIKDDYEFTRQTSELLSHARLKTFVTLTPELRDPWLKRILSLQDLNLAIFYGGSLPEEFYPELPADVCRRLSENNKSFASSIAKSNRGGTECLSAVRESLKATMIFDFPRAHLFATSDAGLWLNPSGTSAFKIESGLLSPNDRSHRITFFDFVNGKMKEHIFADRNDGSVLAKIFSNFFAKDIAVHPEGVSVIRDNQCLVNQIGTDGNLISTFQPKTCYVPQPETYYLESPFGLVEKSLEEVTPGCFRLTLYDSFNDRDIVMEGFRRKNKSELKIRISRAQGFFSDVAARYISDSNSMRLLMPGSSCQAKKPEVSVLGDNFPNLPYNHWTVSPALPVNGGESIEHVVLDHKSNGAYGSIVKLVGTAEVYHLPIGITGYDGEYFYEMKDNVAGKKRTLSRLKYKSATINSNKDLDIEFSKMETCRIPSTLPTENDHHEKITLFNFQKAKDSGIRFFSRRNFYQYKSWDHNNDIAVFQTVCDPSTTTDVVYKALRYSHGI